MASVSVPESALLLGDIDPELPAELQSLDFDIGGESDLASVSDERYGWVIAVQRALDPAGTSAELKRVRSAVRSGGWVVVWLKEVVDARRLQLTDVVDVLELSEMGYAIAQDLEHRGQNAHFIVRRVDHHTVG